MTLEPIATVDPVATLRALLLARLAGTELEALVVRGEREASDAPPLVLLSEAGGLTHRSVPVHYPARVTVAAYALSAAAAAQLYRQVASRLHRAGPQIVGAAGVWKVFDETGMQRPLPDPDSGWWRAAGVFDLYMTDRAIGA